MKDKLNRKSQNQRNSLKNTHHGKAKIKSNQYMKK